MIVITADGKVSEREYHGDIKEIYDATNCETFDIVRLSQNLVMFVDDEGLFRNLDAGRPRWNWKATYLRLIQWMENPQDINWTMARQSLPPLIAGEVCILSARNQDGDTLDLDEAERGMVLEWLGEDQS